jgi:pyruvate-formate lyase
VGETRSVTLSEVMALDASAQKNRAMPEQTIRERMRFCVFISLHVQSEDHASDGRKDLYAKFFASSLPHMACDSTNGVKSGIL